MEPQDTWPSDDEGQTPDYGVNFFYREFLSLQPDERKGALLRWLGMDGVERALHDLTIYSTTDIDDDRLSPITTPALIEKIKNAEGLYHMLLETPSAAVETSLQALWEANRHRARAVVAYTYPLMALMDRPDVGPAAPYHPGSNTQFWQWIEHYGYDYALLHDFFTHLDDPVLEDAWRAARARARIFKLAQGDLLTTLGLT
jgi:hypothetical protein